MSGNLAFYFYTASLDLHAQETKVFVADVLTDGRVIAAANAHRLPSINVLQNVEDIQVPHTVMNRFGVGSAEASYFMARYAYNQDIIDSSARKKLGLALTADVQNIYIAFARSSEKGYARNPDINVYQYPRSESDVVQQAAVETANILFNYACRGYVAPAHVTPVHKLPCPKLNCAA